MNNSTCANIFQSKRLKTIKTFSKDFDWIKLKAFCVLLGKPVLCKRKDVDYMYCFFLLFKNL